jgi:hypothetical protein
MAYNMKEDDGRENTMQKYSPCPYAPNTGMTTNTFE